MAQKRYVTIKASCDNCGAREEAAAASIDDAQQLLIDRGWHIYGFRPQHDFCRCCSEDIDDAIQKVLQYA